MDRLERNLHRAPSATSVSRTDADSEAKAPHSAPGEVRATPAAHSPAEIPPQAIVSPERQAVLNRTAALLSVQEQLGDSLDDVVAAPHEADEDSAPPPPPAPPSLAGYISQKLQVWGESAASMTASDDATPAEEVQTPAAKDASPAQAKVEPPPLPPMDEADGGTPELVPRPAPETSAAARATANAAESTRNLQHALALHGLLQGDGHVPHVLGDMLAEMLHLVAPDLMTEEEEKLESEPDTQAAAEGEEEGADSPQAGPAGLLPSPSDAVVASNLESILNRSHRREASHKQAAARLLLVILKAHGAYTYEHCVRLVGLGLSLAKALGYEDDQLYKEIEYGVTYKDVGEIDYFMTRQSASYKQALAAYLGGINLAQGAMLHDFGKIKVPPEILYKPGLLTPDEVLVMQQHPVWGADILAAIPSLAHAVPATRHHHERWDGRGYPDRLAGSHIPLSARLVGVVDSFDAMVAERPYRQSLTVEAARTEIERCAGSQFDPDIAHCFARIVEREWHPDDP